MAMALSFEIEGEVAVAKTKPGKSLLVGIAIAAIYAATAIGSGIYVLKHNPKKSAKEPTPAHRFSAKESAKESTQESAKESTQDTASSDPDETAKPTQTIKPAEFYDTYKGHEVRFLKIIWEHAVKRSKRPVIFLAGDSSLDNKHWLKPQFLKEKAKYVPAVNGYQGVLAEMRQDVTYWLNRQLADDASNSFFALNTAIEESKVTQRTGEGAGESESESLPNLPEQDAFIQNRMTAKDYLIVSVGSNDFALLVKHNATFSAQVVKDYSQTNLKDISDDIRHARSPTSQFLVDVFKTKVTRYIQRLVSQNKPKLVLICMIYYPSLVGNGWATNIVKALGEKKWHAIIDALFVHATKQITEKNVGTELKHIQLSKALDGSVPDDYVNQVEPSVEGGKKLAKFFLDHIPQNVDN